MFWISPQNVLLFLVNQHRQKEKKSLLNRKNQPLNKNLAVLKHKLNGASTKMARITCFLLIAGEYISLSKKKIFTLNLLFHVIHI
jgi:hypothetical protein